MLVIVEAIKQALAGRYSHHIPGRQSVGFNGWLFGRVPVQSVTRANGAVDRWRLNTFIGAERNDDLKKDWANELLSGTLEST